MILYLFWHWPAVAEGYERHLAAFHEALAGDPPTGFLRSTTARLPEAPWLPEGGFEDRYFLRDFAALEALSQDAVTGSRRDPHDAVARRAAGGIGGISRLRTGPEPPDGECRTWFRKPPGLTYAGFDALLVPIVTAAGASLWQRQMNLGPGLEFCLDSAAPVALPAEFAPLLLRAVPLWPTGPTGP